MALIMAALAWPALAAGPKSPLAPPVQIHAGGKPIDVDMGNAAPCAADLNGDGKLSLLVGQFAGGKLRVYRNAGSKTQLRFEGFDYLKVGEAIASVPVG
jgi:hypothetical protein